MRVDHAGEYGAVRIYQGQIATACQGDAKNIMLHMLEQEKRHFQFFDEQIKQDNIRPTVFLPLWSVLGFALGFITSYCGTKTAMLCTEAVETVIDKHYSEQIIDLKNIEDESGLIDVIDKYRLEELEHKDIASEYSDYSVKSIFLKRVIENMCKCAIAISKI